MIQPISPALNALQKQITQNALTKYQTPASLSGDSALKDQIAETVFPSVTRSNKAGFNASVLNLVYDAMNKGYIDSYSGSNPSDCSKARQNPNASALGLTSQATSYGVQGLGLLTALKVVNLVPVVGQIVGAAVGIFQTILHLFGSHAAAVQAEQTILCAVVPAVNDAVAKLDQGVAYGQISGPDAYNGMNQILAGYEQNVRPIIKNNPGQCNAACDIDRAVRGLLMYKAAKYSQILAGVSTDLVDVSGNVSSTIAASNPVTPIVNTVNSIAGTSISPNAGLVGIIGIILLFFFL